MANYPLIGASAESVAIESRVSPDDLVRDISDIRDSLAQVMQDPGGGGLALKSMEVALAIEASGKVGFLGSGAEAKGSASITLTFEH